MTQDSLLFPIETSPVYRSNPLIRRFYPDTASTNQQSYLDELFEECVPRYLLNGVPDISWVEFGHIHDALSCSSLMVRFGNDLNVTLFPLKFMAISKLDERNDFGREKEESLDGREIKKSKYPTIVLDTKSCPTFYPRSIVKQEKAHARKPEGLPVKPHVQAFRIGELWS